MSKTVPKIAGKRAQSTGPAVRPLSRAAGSGAKAPPLAARATVAQVLKNIPKNSSSSYLCSNG